MNPLVCLRCATMLYLRWTGMALEVDKCPCGQEHVAHIIVVP